MTAWNICWRVRWRMCEPTNSAIGENEESECNPTARRRFYGRHGETSAKAEYDV